MPTRKPTINDREAGTWISWQGFPAQFQAIGAETDNSYCVSRATSLPGYGTPPHAHSFEEGFYILRGTLRFRAGNAEIIGKAGDFINVGGDVAHQLQTESEEPAEVIIVTAPSGFDAFQLEAGTPVAGPEGPFLPATEEDRERMFEAAKRHQIDLHPEPEAFEKPGRVIHRRPEDGVVIDAVGDRYRFLATSEDTAGQYALWEARISPGGGPPRHIHEREEEGFYILEGELSFYTDEASFTAGPGTLVNLPKDSPHWFRNESEDTVRALILVAPGGLEAMFEETGVKVESVDDPIAAPHPSEKERLLAVAPRFGVSITLPAD